MSYKGLALSIPLKIKTLFDLHLAKKNIILKEHDNYKRWITYCLDFCSKYRFDKLKKSCAVRQGCINHQKMYNIKYDYADYI